MEIDDEEDEQWWCEDGGYAVICRDRQGEKAEGKKKAVRGTGVLS